MNTLRRSAAICGALLALPVVAIVVLRGRQELRPVSIEARPREPTTTPARVVEQPMAREPAREVTPVTPAAPAAALPPATPPPERVLDYAVGADENGAKTDFAPSDPDGVERPARLELSAVRRATEAQAEIP